VLQPQQTEVREIYYVCLSLGFTGRYCNPGDEILLNQLRASNLKLLTGAGFGQDAQAADILFPDGYPDGDMPEFGSKRKFFTIATLVGGGVPVALLLFLFGVYRFVLNNVGENLINSIR
jgi:type VI secretion system protein ImpK